MPDIRNICLIDAPVVFGEAFTELGCNVLHLKTSPELMVDVPEALAEHYFEPDIVLQYECLSGRSVLVGLETMDCPLMFWAIDPYLNIHWQSAYAHLFDVFFSLQKGAIPQLKGLGAPDVRWLPPYGYKSDWVDMSDRTHDIAFVGRITGQRSARTWMVELIRKNAAGYNLAVRQNIPFAKMMDLYRDARLLPNESIYGEINFRLFEAASCGCLVLGQDLGEEQELLFEPGREFDTYANAVELDEKLSMYLKNRRLLQAVGRAAFERIQRDHLPTHRAQQVIEIARKASKKRTLGKERAKWTALTVSALKESGQFDLPAQKVLSLLAAAPQDHDVVAATLRIQALLGQAALVQENLTMILGRQMYVDSLDINLVGSMASLRMDNWDGAKAFWFRQVQSTESGKAEMPDTPIELLTLWAKLLKRCDRILRPGFSYDPTTNLPATAIECLMDVLVIEPEHVPSLRLLDALLRPISALEQMRLGFLSVLTLHERDDWRLAFELALSNLKTYRLESGLEEMHLAREMARSQGQEKYFDRALAARDRSGLIAVRLR